MKYTLSIMLLIFPIFVSAEVYKCKDPNGKLGFSDKPCTKGLAQEKLEVKSKETDWVSRLESEKSASIEISNVLRQDGDVIIQYEFKTRSDSDEFMRLANKVSNIPVVLLKFIDPKSGQLGRAELKVSNKPNPLFDKIRKH